MVLKSTAQRAEKNQNQYGQKVGPLLVDSKKQDTECQQGTFLPAIQVLFVLLINLPEKQMETCFDFLQCGEWSNADCK